MAATATIPKLKHNSLKFWWSQAADEIKEKSITSHRIWVENKKPHSGPIHETIKNAKYRYKLFLKEQKQSQNKDITDNLYNNLILKDTTSFWKTFKSKLGAKTSYEKVIDGKLREPEIPEIFASTFSKICNPNSPEHFTKAYNLYTEKKSNYKEHPPNETPFSLYFSLFSKKATYIPRSTWI